MSSLSGIGTAVIGSGFIGTVHIEALRRIGVRRHRPARVVPGLGAPARGRPRAADGYASLDELLADDAVRVVHVTSPNELHHPQVKQILAAGRHVVCEKPLAMTSAESAELVALAAASGLVNAVNFNIRFYPLNQHVASLVRDGGVGDVRLVTGRYFQDWLLYDTDWNWRLEKDQGGALRAVGDIGSHRLDLTTVLTGLRVESVMADLTTFIPVRRKPAGPVVTFSTERAADTIPVEIQTEDVATILLRFEGGARGSVAISQLSPGRKNSLVYQIDGAAAAVSWDSEQPDQLGSAIATGQRAAAPQPGPENAAGAAAARCRAGSGGLGDTFGAVSLLYADVAAGRPRRARYATSPTPEEIFRGRAWRSSRRPVVAIDREPAPRAAQIRCRPSRSPPHLIPCSAPETSRDEARLA